MEKNQPPRPQGRPRKRNGQWGQTLQRDREARVLNYSVPGTENQRAMLFSKEYVGYLAREVTEKLIANEFIETAEKNAVRERINQALIDELSVEDRINDEVRVILEAYSEEMRRSGASYQEMFKKVKNELVRKYKAVL